MELINEEVENSLIDKEIAVIKINFINSQYSSGKTDYATFNGIGFKNYDGSLYVKFRVSILEFFRKAANESVQFTQYSDKFYPSEPIYKQSAYGLFDSIIKAITTEPVDFAQMIKQQGFIEQIEDMPFVGMVRLYTKEEKRKSQLVTAIPRSSSRYPRSFAIHKTLATHSQPKT